VSARRDKLKSAHCCFLFLNRGHNARGCSRKGWALCTRYKGAHHRSRCNEAGTATAPTRETTLTAIGKIVVASPDFTYLQTARVWVMGPTSLHESWTAEVSQASWLRLIDDLKLEIVDRRDLVVSAFESRSSGSGPRLVVRFCAKSIWENTTVPITAFESTHALCPHPTVPHYITTMTQARKIQLADPRAGEQDLPIEVVIRGYCYWRIVKDASTICLSSSLVLLPTKFGWILTGNRTGITAYQIMDNHITLEHFDSDL